MIGGEEGGDFQGNGGIGGVAGLPRDLQAVMFDLDGTLIDSIPVYLRIASAILEEVGLPQVPRDVVGAVLKEGRSGFDRLIPCEMSHRKDELLAACFKAGKDITSRLYSVPAPLIPGVRELFFRLREAGIRIGIVSSSQRGPIERKLFPFREAGIDTLVASIIAREDTSEMKPSSEPVTACAIRLGVEEARTLFVGDTEVDILAGKRAGTFTAGVLTGVDDYETLIAQKPDMILPGVQELISLF